MLKTTREQLEQLKALEAQATPGPWETGVTVHCDCGFSPNCWHTFGVQADVIPPSGEAGPVAITHEQFHDNAAVIAESRNALDALLHDAAVAHRLVAGIHTVISDLRAQIMAEFPHPSEENRRNNDHLEGWITGARQIAYDLEALLSAAKGAE